MSAAASNEYAGVDDLGPDAPLATLRDTDLTERSAARDKLRLAYQWCIVHPANVDTGVAQWGDPGLPGDLDADESLGGPGTPAVAAFTPEPFAAALGVSTLTGMGLLADALDLVHRRPLLWAAVQDLTVPAWKARKIARDTHPLSQDAAAFVDRTLAGRVASAGAARIEAVIAQAVATFHPAAHAERESRGRESWDVRLVHPPAAEFTGTSDLIARGDTLDLTKFHDLVCQTAADLAALGDAEPSVPGRPKLSASSPTTKPPSICITCWVTPPTSPRVARRAQNDLLDHRPDRPGRMRGPGSTCTSTSPTSTSPSLSGPSSGSGQPPSPRSAAGSAPHTSPSGPCCGWTETTPSTLTTYPPGCGTS